MADENDIDFEFYDEDDSPEVEKVTIDNVNNIYLRYSRKVQKIMIQIEYLIVIKQEKLYKAIEIKINFLGFKKHQK